MLIQPENLALFDSLKLDYIQVYIQKLTKLLTPQLITKSEYRNANSVPPLRLLCKYL